MTLDELLALARQKRDRASAAIEAAQAEIRTIRSAPQLDGDRLGAAQRRLSDLQADLRQHDRDVERLLADQRRDAAVERLQNSPAAAAGADGLAGIVESVRATLAATLSTRNERAAAGDTDAVQRLDAEIDVLEARLAELHDDEQRGAAVAALNDDLPDTERTGAMPAYTRSRDTYSAERDKRGERSFFADLFASQVHNDVGARQRIDAYNAERAVSTGGFAGLVPPDYLVEQAALIARASRPFADSVQRLQLPNEGMSLIVPRSTTGAAVAAQATENSTVQNTDEVWTNLTVPVATIAGQAQVSRQSLERGAPGLDAMVYADLAGAYSAELERQTLSGSGASGQMLGVLGTSGIHQASALAAVVTAATFQSKVAGEVNAVSSNRFLPPSHIAMHPRRWAWLLSLTDSSNRPLVLPAIQGPNNAVADGGAADAYGVTPYTFQGLRVVISAQIPTAVGTGPEDQVVVYRAADLLLWENGDGMPTELRFEQTAGQNLTTTLVSYGYAAFTAGRYPAAVGVIGGNAAAGMGLKDPTSAF